MRQFLVLLSFSLLLFSCDDDLSLDGTQSGTVEEDLNLNIKLTYGGEPLVMFEEINYPDDTRMRITKVSGYITDLKATKDGVSTTLKQVDYLEISESHLNPTAAAKGFDYDLGGQAKGAYDGISFGLGLPASINEDTTPSDYSSSSPLSKTSEYWSNWGSYIFWKIEGNIDFNADGEYGSGENIALHLGSDKAFKQVNLTTNSATSDLEMTMDLKTVFENDGALYDIAAMPTIHASLSDEVLNRISQLADNMRDSFTLK